MARWQWILLRLTRKLWVRATAIGALGVLSAFAATLAERYLPARLSEGMTADAVESILSIIASSMLAVTTFSLSIMTSAYGSTTNTATPRATILLIEDRVAQNALSTFVGSFLFSIVALVVLKTGAYGPRGRTVLFLMTVVVIVLVVIALLRWINHLTLFGRVGETTERVERATLTAIEARIEEPFLGGRELTNPEDNIPNDAHPVYAGVTGYVQFVDMASLDSYTRSTDSEIFLIAIPGTFVYPRTVVGWISGGDKDETEVSRREAAVMDAVRIDTMRSYHQDPRFGIAVLTEIGTRALSSAINDPGTAIDVIGRHARLLARWAEGTRSMKNTQPRFDRVHVIALTSNDLLDDAFRIMARDGAALLEVQLRLQKTLCALCEMGDQNFQVAARHQAQQALKRALEKMTFEDDKHLLVNAD